MTIDGCSAGALTLMRRIPRCGGSSCGLRSGSALGLIGPKYFSASAKTSAG
jgi:hypothetical protein